MAGLSDGEIDQRLADYRTYRTPKMSAPEGPPRSALDDDAIDAILAAVRERASAKAAMSGRRGAEAANRARQAKKAAKARLTVIEGGA